MTKTAVISSVSTIDGFIKAVHKATTSLHALLEAYYQSCADQARWEDDGGAL